VLSRGIKRECSYFSVVFNFLIWNGFCLSQNSIWQSCSHLQLSSLSFHLSCSQLTVPNLVLPRWPLTTLLLAGGKRCTRLHLLQKQGGWQQTQKITEVTEFKVEVVSSKVARQQSRTLEKKFISMSNQDKKEGLNWWMSLFMSFHASKQCNIWNVDILGILSENPAALILSFQSLARLFTFSCSAVTLVPWPVMKCCSKWKGELKPSETH
jgi:hypothetical protein